MPKRLTMVTWHVTCPKLKIKEIGELVAVLLCLDK